MREPPPSPLETTARSLLKDHRLYKPYRRSLGFQKLCFIRWGLRGNDPGGYALPRSNRQTRKPASLSLYVITEPPNPEPITTASKCSPSISNSYRARLARGLTVWIITIYTTVVIGSYGGDHRPQRLQAWGGYWGRDACDAGYGLRRTLLPRRWVDSRIGPVRTVLDRRGQRSAPAQEGHDSDTSDDVPGPICLVH